MKPMRSNSIDTVSTPLGTVRMPHRGLAISILLPAMLTLVLALPACKRSDAADSKTAAAQSASSGSDDKDGKDGKKEDTAVPVEIAKVSRHPVAASYSGTATLDAPGEAQVVSKTSGIVLDILTEEGHRVQKGQVLARLDSEHQRLEVAQAEAAVRKLEANYERSQKMVAAKLVSTEANDQIRYDLESAHAALDLAQLELSYTDVLAPISGVVAQRSIKTGNFVQINTPIIRIVDNSQLQATLNVPERELATLKSGLPVVLLVDALPGKQFAGRVDRIAPVVDSGSGTFRVVCAFEGGGVLRPGMFGRIRIDYDRRADALVVPRVALLEDAGDPAVFSVREGKAVRVPVTLGYIDGQWAEIRSGLTEGDPVVTAGKVAIRDGSAVQVIGASDGEGPTVRRPPTTPPRTEPRSQRVKLANTSFNLVEFSTRRRVTIAMVTITFVLFGLIALGDLKVNLLPDLSYPTLTVRTDYTGSAPTEIETLVTQPVEEAVGVVKNLRKLSSTSRTGQSDVVLEFAWGTDMDKAGLDVRDKLEVLQLPTDAKPPVLLRFNPSTEPIMRLVLSPKGEAASDAGRSAAADAPAPLRRRRSEEAP